MNDIPATICGFPVVVSDRVPTIKGTIVLDSLHGWIARIRDTLLRDQAELLDAQFTGDKDREAKAQQRMAVWERWAASLPSEE